MTKKRIALALAALLAIIFVDHVGLRLKCNPQQIGVLTLKPHYRGWFASFRDGTAFIDSQWVSVVYNDDGSFHKFGYRWWPRFYRLEMKEWTEDMYANVR